jgi:NAD(P)-dependent dehydrogenase (short-subunit alcohol dehydrogenase family)
VIHSTSGDRDAGRVVIVAGGGSGMGAAAAKLFAARGDLVVIADADLARASGVAEDLESSGQEAIAAEVDVTVERSVKVLRADVERRFGTCHALVNCVGVSEFCPSTEMSLRQWEGNIAVNLTGTFLMCREIGAVMIARGGGKIVNVSSTAGLFGVPAMTAYVAAKHGVIGLTRALAVEWARFNVQVNCVCPGATLTEMLLSATTPEYRAKRLGRIPAHRFGLPEEQGAVMLFLTSAAADYITGCVLAVDGGVSALAPGTDSDELRRSANEQEEGAR